jgi:high-affinity K+ transport system ATPase subunit B
MNWLYILSGGFAFYSVETADASQPIHITAIIALMLLSIPTTIDALLSSDKTSGIVRTMWKTSSAAKLEE